MNTHFIHFKAIVNQQGQLTILKFNQVKLNIFEVRAIFATSFLVNVSELQSIYPTSAFKNFVHFERKDYKLL